MTEDKIAILRAELVADNTSGLKTIYSENKVDCISFLKNKGYANPDEGEGIFTDAILVLHTNIIAGKVSEIKSMKNYLIGICINLSLKKHQKVTKFRDKIDEIKSFFIQNNDESLDDGEQQSELMKSVSQQAINKLSDQCRKIITFFYLYQMSMKEIALDLKLSSSDVAKTLKSRCFRTLMEKVNQLMPLTK